MSKVRRSLAWVIGGDDQKLQEALASEADVITFELEDLCPAGAKEKARAWVVETLRHTDFGSKEVAVRINSFDSPWGRRDLEAVLPCLPDIIRLPKCENPRDVLDVDAIITQYELTHDKPRNTVELFLMIETPLGVRNAYELASCSSRVTGLTLGAVDLTTALGVKRDLTEKSLQLVYAKQKLVMDARAAGVDAFDTAVFCPEGENPDVEAFVRTDTEDHLMEDFTKFNEWAPMRRMAVGGYKHIFECWENYERFNCDMIMMYDQIQCKGMTGIHGMFEDEFRNRGIPACWMPHALDDRRPVTRAEIRNAINEYMSTVMKEEPLDPTLLEFDDEASW